MLEKRNGVPFGFHFLWPSCSGRECAVIFPIYPGNGNECALSIWPEDVAPLAYRKRLTATRPSYLAGFDGDMVCCVDGYALIKLLFL
jgi:hypothetical protein